MTGVTTPLFRYHPAVVAQAAATIDRLSQGRFILGVGTGESINEIPLGLPFPRYRERADRMIEALIIMKKLLQGEKVTYDGKYYQTHNAKLYSPPIAKVPIYMAAGGAQSAQLAAEYSDGIITSVKSVPETIRDVLESAYAKTPDIPCVATEWVVYAKSKEEAYQALKPWRGLRTPSRLSASDPSELEREADAMQHDDIVSHYTQVSDAAGYIDAYAPLITQLHANDIVIQTTSASSQEDLIKMLGKEVLPSLKSL